jgi:hypothetical protein
MMRLSELFEDSSGTLLSLGLRSCPIERTRCDDACDVPELTAEIPERSSVVIQAAMEAFHLISARDKPEYAPWSQGARHSNSQGSEGIDHVAMSIEFHVEKLTKMLLPVRYDEVGMISDGEVREHLPKKFIILSSVIGEQKLPCEHGKDGTRAKRLIGLDSANSKRKIHQDNSEHDPANRLYT